MARWPVSNFALIGGISLVSITALIDTDAVPVDMMVLDGWSLSGLVGHMFLHADIVHLVGNMVFLWVFGNAICAKIGNLFYAAVFLLMGVGAGVVHNLFDGAAAVGASGAINGVVGAFLVLYPINEISCAWIFFFRTGVVSISSAWLIVLWLAFDIWGAVSASEGVAYWAHIGGFAMGLGIAIALLKLNCIQMDSTERSLLDVMADRD